MGVHIVLHSNGKVTEMRKTQRKHCSRLQINLRSVNFLSFFFFFFTFQSSLDFWWPLTSCNKEDKFSASTEQLSGILGQCGHESYMCRFKGIWGIDVLQRHVFCCCCFFAFVCLLPSSLSDLQASRDTTLQNSGVERDYLFFFSRLIYSLHTKHVISVRFNLLLTLFVQ